MDENKAVTMEEVSPEVKEPITEGEANPIARIRLDENGRCIAMDCTYLESDIVIEKEHSELPLPYNEFARVMDQYVYKNDEFIHQPIKYDSDPIQRLIEEQDRQGKALEEIISVIMGG